MDKKAYMNQNISTERGILPKPSEGESAEHQEESHNKKKRPKPGSNSGSRLKSSLQTNRPIAQGKPLEQGQRQLSSESSSGSSSGPYPKSSSDSSPRPPRKKRVRAWKRDPEYVNRFQTNPNHFPTTQKSSSKSSQNTVPSSQPTQTQDLKDFRSRLINPEDFDWSSYNPRPPGSFLIPVKTRRLGQEDYDPPLSGSTTESEDFTLLKPKSLPVQEAPECSAEKQDSIKEEK